VPHRRFRASVCRIIALTARTAGTGDPVNHLKQAKQTKLQKEAHYHVNRSYNPCSDHR
jgi:hypothetical protein